MDILKLKHTPNFRKNYLNPAIEKEYLEMTIPETPNSINQKYRLTESGKVLKSYLKKALNKNKERNN